MAFNKGVMDGARYQASEYVRKMANKAAHPETVLDEGLCKSAFDATRGILQHLYE